MGGLGNPKPAPIFNLFIRGLLLTIENFARLNEWIEQGEVDIQVWLGIRGTIKADNPSVQWNWAIAAEAASVLRNIAGPPCRTRYV